MALSSYAGSFQPVCMLQHNYLCVCSAAVALLHWSYCTADSHRSTGMHLPNGTLLPHGRKPCQAVFTFHCRLLGLRITTKGIAHSLGQPTHSNTQQGHSNVPQGFILNCLGREDPKQYERINLSLSDHTGQHLVQQCPPLHQSDQCRSVTHKYAQTCMYTQIRTYTHIRMHALTRAYTYRSPWMSSSTSAKPAGCGKEQNHRAACRCQMGGSNSQPRAAPLPQLRPRRHSQPRCAVPSSAHPVCCPSSAHPVRWPLLCASSALPPPVHIQCADLWAPWIS